MRHGVVLSVILEDLLGMMKSYQGHCPWQREEPCESYLHRPILPPPAPLTVYVTSDIPAGDLRNQSLKEIWEKSEILTDFRNVEKSKLKGRCQTCRYAAAQCQGGCRASAYALTGDLWAEDPLCWHPGH